MMYSESGGLVLIFQARPPAFQGDLVFALAARTEYNLSRPADVTIFLIRSGGLTMQGERERKRVAPATTATT
jgi:hypothetical protein